MCIIRVNVKQEHFFFFKHAICTQKKKKVKKKRKKIVLLVTKVLINNVQRVYYQEYYLIKVFHVEYGIDIMVVTKKKKKKNVDRTPRARHIFLLHLGFMPVNSLLCTWAGDSTRKRYVLWYMKKKNLKPEKGYIILEASHIFRNLLNISYIHF
jgi:hypothetical protein